MSSGQRSEAGTRGTYRGGLRGVQTLPPQADSLQGTQVRRAPVEPFVVAPAPAAVVDQNPLLVVVDLLYGGRVPERTTSKTGVNERRVKQVKQVKQIKQVKQVKQL